MPYVVNFNGGNIEKKFTREFLNFVCNNEINDAVLWHNCTRKRLIVTSRRAVDQLLALNKRVFWPEGKVFRCYLRNGGGGSSSRRHNRYTQKREDEINKNNVDKNNVEDYSNKDREHTIKRYKNDSGYDKYETPPTPPSIESPERSDSLMNWYEQMEMQMLKDYEVDKLSP